MRLVIYFYIVLGLFKLFEGLTHGVHSNSARERETKVKGTSQWSWMMGKGWIFAAMVWVRCLSSILYFSDVLDASKKWDPSISALCLVMMQSGILKKFLPLGLFWSLLQKSWSFSAVVGTGFFVREDRNLGRVECFGVTLRARPFPGALLDWSSGFRTVFLINLLPAGLESPSAGRLLYHGLFLVFLTDIEEQER